MVDGKYIKNQAADGWKPVCGKCKKAFPDAEIGDTKNYPEDGLLAVFYTCESCHEESDFVYQPYEPEKSRVSS
jgi:hypothetical protein